MAISQTALGINARNTLYIREMNSTKARRIADNKLRTKKTFLEAGIATSALLASFSNRREVVEFDWASLPRRFVLKPAHGYGGNGIMIVKKWNGETGESVSGNIIYLEDIERQIFDILAGEHSLGLVSDSAFIEEFIVSAPFFKKMQPTGLPDIRMIVINGVPVMSMLRFPTEGSGGRANIHQGAIGLGIDMATGITTGGVQYRKLIEHFPGTKVKTRGLKIPFWDDILVLASKGQRASQLGFAGIDIVIAKTRGPLIIEVNARPGLEIQNINRASLRTRLERLHHMKTPSLSRSVRIAKALFAEDTLDAIMMNKGRVLGAVEPVVLTGNGKEHEVFARIDTGATRTSIDEELCKELGFQLTGKEISVRSASGQTKRPVAKISYHMHGKHIVGEATVIDRAHMKYPLIVGRKHMDGFLVNPSLVVHRLEDVEGIDIS